ncbi:MAG: hypothetical protein ABSE85_17050 [Candidatus Korobacteraceae bacterium]
MSPQFLYFSPEPEQHGLIASILNLLDPAHEMAVMLTVTAVIPQHTAIVHRGKS